MTSNPILIVEDNPDDQTMIIRNLAKSNLKNQMVVANDGVEAFDMLHATGARRGEKPLDPAVVLLDIGLPKLSGIDVLQRLRADERTKALPVVMLTSSDEERDISRCYALGVNSYVCKPVKFEHFARAVRELGLYWVLLNKRADN